jgi:hypothetical protein
LVMFDFLGWSLQESLYAVIFLSVEEFFKFPCCCVE